MTYFSSPSFFQPDKFLQILSYFRLAYNKIGSQEIRC